jgi:hypothetical protein
MKYFTIILLAASLLFGCKPKQEVTKTPVSETSHTAVHDNELTVDEPRDSTSILPISILESNNMKEAGDPFTIREAKIENNQLWLAVSYGGGCEEHQFKMLFNNAYTEMKNEEGEAQSKIKLNVHHTGNNDRCRSIVRQNLRFDLTAVQDKGIQQLTIELNNWEEILTYTY